MIFLCVENALKCRFAVANIEKVEFSTKKKKKKDAFFYFFIIKYPQMRIKMPNFAASNVKTT